MIYYIWSHLIRGCWIILIIRLAIGENSKEAKWLRKEGKTAGLNDNLARELLELHTVSPARKYSETDIRNTAKVLAGWGVCYDLYKEYYL